MSKPVSDKRHRVSRQIVTHAAQLCFRLLLSLQLVEDMRLKLGIAVSRETVPRKAIKFEPSSPAASGAWKS